MNFLNDPRYVSTITAADCCSSWPIFFYSFSQLGGTAAAFPPPFRPGIPAPYRSQPLVTSSFIVDLETKSFCVFCVFLRVFIADRVAIYIWLVLCVWLFVSTSSSDCLERLVSEMTYYVWSRA